MGFDLGGLVSSASTVVSTVGTAAVEGAAVYASIKASAKGKDTIVIAGKTVDVDTLQTKETVAATKAVDYKFYGIVVGATFGAMLLILLISKK